MAKLSLAAASIIAVSATAFAQDYDAPSRFPAAIRPADGVAVYLTAPATGFQIYTCEKNASGVPVWTFKAPEAQLFDTDNRPIGKHYGGPTWHGNDGGKVVAAVRASAPAPGEGAIPWLLLDVTSSAGSGAFSEAKAVLRIMTVGGTMPASGCDDAHTGSESKVPYTATYLFLK